MKTKHILRPLLATLCCHAQFTLAQDDSAAEIPLYLTLDTPPAPVLTPAQELASFRIAPGFRAELVAAEPLVEDPVSIKWDEDGRLYVVEMRGFMPDAYGNGEDEPVGSIVRLHDDNADGVMDRREVLLDKLVLPRAIAIVPEGLLIAEPPNLWLCPSEINNAATINCDDKVSLGDYGTQPGSVEHAENGLLLNLNNWIYNAKSDRKFRLRDGELEIGKTVFRGQWAITQDDDGNLYYNGNSNLVTGDLYSDNDVIRAGIVSAAGLQQRMVRGDQVYSIRVNPGVNRAYRDGVLREDGRLNGPTAASGVEVYRATQFPTDYYDSAFIPESAGNLVARVQLFREDLDTRTEHPTYADPDWGQRDFLASTDERFRPVEIKTGPDGGLYVVDMYRGIIQDHIYLTDQLRDQVFERELEEPLGKGRIWRIVYENNTISHQAPNLSTASTAELVETLAHGDGWWRDTAQRLLVASPDASVSSELTPALFSDNVLQAVHALWALEGRDELTRVHLQALLSRNNERLSLHALRAGCDLLDSEALLSFVSNNQISQRNRQAALFCMSRHPADEIFDFLTSNINELVENPYLTVALQTATLDNELAFLEFLNSPARRSNLTSNAKLADFFQQLTKQYLTSNKDSRKDISGLLDEVLASSSIGPHHRLLLTSIYEAAHIESFERIVLDQPHSLFSTATVSRFPESQSLIADVRRAFTWNGDDLSADQRPLDLAGQRLMDTGAELYTATCAACHSSDGNGAIGLAPQLRGSERITNAPEQVVRIILQGLAGPLTVAGEEWNSDMPGMAEQAGFDDEGISGLITYLRRSWGHSGSPMSPDTVRQIREQTSGRTQQWSAEELSEVPVNLHYEAYVGTFGGLEFSYDGRQLHVSTSVASGPMEEIREGVFFFEPRGYNVEFDRLEDGRAQSLWILGDSGARRRLNRSSQ